MKVAGGIYCSDYVYAAGKTRQGISKLAFGYGHLKSAIYIIITGIAKTLVLIITCQ